MGTANPTEMAAQRIALADSELAQFRELIHAHTGIHITAAKRSLIENRLMKRLRHFACQSFGEYYNRIVDDVSGDELRILVDLITTNETYFFREPTAFRFLGQSLQNKAEPGLRVWSAAASSCQEAYSIAMVLADRLPEHNNDWEILASDINCEVLEKGRRAIYAIDEAAEIPQYYREKYCLRGVGSMQGQFTIEAELRRHVRFQRINLCDTLPEVPRFDWIFLRNFLIYIAPHEKNDIVERVARRLKRGGYLILGLAESIQCPGLEKIQPSIYRKSSHD